MMREQLMKACLRARSCVCLMAASDVSHAFRSMCECVRIHTSIEGGDGKSSGSHPSSPSGALHLFPCVCITCNTVCP